MQGIQTILQWVIDFLSINLGAGITPRAFILMFFGFIVSISLYKYLAEKLGY